MYHKNILQCIYHYSICIKLVILLWLWYFLRIFLTYLIVNDTNYIILSNLALDITQKNITLRQEKRKKEKKIGNTLNAEFSLGYQFDYAFFLKPSGPVWKVVRIVLVFQKYNLGQKKNKPRQIMNPISYNYQEINKNNPLFLRKITVT